MDYDLAGNPIDPVSGRRIVTDFVYPPIPDRRWDWVATLEGWEPGEPYGQGATEEAAIADLRMELEARQ